jgi:hypothetical protein
VKYVINADHMHAYKCCGNTDSKQSVNTVAIM